MIEFRHSKNQAFYDYWHNLPRTGILPDKSSFKPEEIPSLLSTMLVYELVSHDFIRIRLIGSTVEERFGGHRTGTNYLDVVEEHRKPSASAALWSQVEKPCGMHVLLEQELMSGRIASIEAVGLPISNIEGGHPLILFQNNEISRDQDDVSLIDQHQLDDKKNRLLKYVRVFERTFFDLGAGVSEFRD
ncbi:PAS domain-containing protein [Kiloniella majae]|uniref:PAS domain-containing protein n=1 Tax=Kiloniella majae TaxID=1938558 RepID=UPI000A279452|nr:PAS domain-containing protein [Kiloniella majae]